MSEIPTYYISPENKP